MKRLDCRRPSLHIGRNRRLAVIALTRQFSCRAQIGVTQVFQMDVIRLTQPQIAQSGEEPLSGHIWIEGTEYRRHARPCGYPVIGAPDGLLIGLDHITKLMAVHRKG